MKIAVSATAPHLDADLDPRFGRCQYLLVVDSESMEFEAIENPAMSAPGGAGVQAAQLVAQEGVEAVITGDCGPNAYQGALAAGIPVYAGTCRHGKLRDVVEAFREESSPCRPSLDRSRRGHERWHGRRPQRSDGRRS